MKAKPRRGTGIIVVVSALIAVSVAVLGAMHTIRHFAMKSIIKSMVKLREGENASFIITYSLTGLHGDETVSFETTSLRKDSLLRVEETSRTGVVQAMPGSMTIEAYVLPGKAAKVIVEGTSVESAHCEIILDGNTYRPRRLETTSTVSDGKLVCSTRELDGTFRYDHQLDGAD